MITIFSIPKPFDNNFGKIQENTIRSWLFLDPKPEIILFGNEDGTKEICEKYKIKHFPDILRNEYDTPLLNDVFSKAKTNASFNILCFINTDIILNPKLPKILDFILSKYKNFLLISQRYDFDLNFDIDFSDKNYFDKLFEKVKKNGKLHPPTGIDYFIYPKDLFDIIPPFAIGRTAYDEWFIYYAKKMKAKVFDLTYIMPVVHQNHPYKTKSGTFFDPWKTKEAEINLKLAGGYGYCYTIEDADYIITENYEIKPKKKSLKNCFIIFKRIIQRIRDRYRFK